MALTSVILDDGGGDGDSGSAGGNDYGLFRFLQEAAYATISLFIGYRHKKEIGAPTKKKNTNMPINNIVLNKISEK